jgi:hypothetical protein
MTETTHLTVPAHLLSCTQLPIGSPARFSWTLDDVAAALQISVRHLKTIRDEDPSFPAPRLLGTVPRWAPASIARWLAGDPAPVAPGADAHDALTEAVPVAGAAGSTRRRKPPAGRSAAKVAAQNLSCTGPVWHV